VRCICGANLSFGLSSSPSSNERFPREAPHDGSCSPSRLQSFFPFSRVTGFFAPFGPAFRHFWPPSCCPFQFCDLYSVICRKSTLGLPWLADATAPPPSHTPLSPECCGSQILFAKATGLRLSLLFLDAGELCSLACLYPSLD